MCWDVYQKCRLCGPGQGIQEICYPNYSRSFILIFFIIKRALQYFVLEYVWKHLPSNVSFHHKTWTQTYLIKMHAHNSKRISKVSKKCLFLHFTRIFSKIWRCSVRFVCFSSLSKEAPCKILPFHILTNFSNLQKILELQNTGTMFCLHCIVDSLFK